MLMLTLDDAVKVASEVIREDWPFDESDEDYLRTELEQKCYFVTRDGSPEKELADLIDDVNVVEIGDHIVSGNLSAWCQTWKTTAIIQLARSMRHWQMDDPPKAGIYEVTFTQEGDIGRYLDYGFWNGTRWYSYKKNGYIADCAEGTKVIAWKERTEPYNG